MPYDNDAYLRALDASRADISRQVQNTLDEVARQERVAQAQADKTRQTAKNVYGQQSQNLNTNLAAMDQGYERYGLSGLGAPVAAQAQNEYGSEVAGALADWGTAQNLIKQGFTEQALQRRGAVGNISQGLFADLDSRRAQYMAQRQAEERAAALAREQIAAQRRMQEEAIRAQQEQAARDADFQRRQAQQQMLQGYFLANPGNARAALKQAAKDPFFQGMDIYSLAELAGLPRTAFDPVAGLPAQNPFYGGIAFSGW